MKRGILAVFSVGIAMFILIVFLYKKNTINDTKSVSGKELFTDKFVESVVSIHFRPFDESEIIAIEEQEKVSEFFEILRNEKYEPIAEFDQVEGGYRFDLVTDDGLEHIGIGSTTIIFGGMQQRAVSGKNLVRGIIEETVHKRPVHS